MIRNALADASLYVRGRLARLENGVYAPNKEEYAMSVQPVGNSASSSIPVRLEPGSFLALPETTRETPETVREERAYEVEIRPPEGYESLDEYIRDWSEKHPMTIKENRILNAREINDWNWLSADVRESRGHQLKYLGAFDFFMREDLSHLSDEEYTDLAYEFRDACIRGKDDPDASAALRGTTVKVRDVDRMYDAMVKAYEQKADVVKEQSLGNWLLRAVDALQILSVKRSLQAEGVCGAFVDMTTDAMSAEAIRGRAWIEEKAPSGYSELYSKLLRTDVSPDGNPRREFGEIIDWLKQDVKEAWGGDYYLSRRIDEIAAGYANGLKEMIKGFGLE